MTGAYNRSPYNRSTHQRGYIGGSVRIDEDCTGLAALGANAGAFLNAAGVLSGEGRLFLKKLERLPLYAAYNRSPYNRSLRRNGYVVGVVHILESLRGHAGSAADTYTEVRKHNQLNGNGKAAQGLSCPLILESRLESTVRAAIGVSAAARVREHLLSEGILGTEVYDVSTLRTRLTGTAYLGVDVYLSGDMRSLLTARAAWGADIAATHRLYEVLLGYAGVKNIEDSMTVIEGTIPPGGVLIIDADNYNMTLQQSGEITDVIHWHQGDWIAVGRSTVDITLSGIGKYDWEVFYHARYL